MESLVDFAKSLAQRPLTSVGSKCLRWFKRMVVSFILLGLNSSQDIHLSRVLPTWNHYSGHLFIVGCWAGCQESRWWCTTCLSIHTQPHPCRKTWGQLAENMGKRKEETWFGRKNTKLSSVRNLCSSRNGETAALRILEQTRVEWARRFNWVWTGQMWFLQETAGNSKGWGRRSWMSIKEIPKNAFGLSFYSFSRMPRLGYIYGERSFSVVKSAIIGSWVFELFVQSQTKR